MATLKNENFRSYSRGMSRLSPQAALHERPLGSIQQIFQGDISSQNKKLVSKAIGQDGLYLGGSGESRVTSITGDTLAVDAFRTFFCVEFKTHFTQAPLLYHFFKAMIPDVPDIEKISRFAYLKEISPDNI